MPPNDPFGIGTPITSGRMTWFNPRPWNYTDPSTDINWTDEQAKARREGAHASGLPLETPGFATAGQGGLGGWHEVTLPDGRKYVTQKTDIGPAGVVDLNAALASQAYPKGPQSVPGGQASARYLGPTLPSGMAPGEVTDRASGSPPGLPELQYALPGGTDAPPGSDYPPGGAVAQGRGRNMPDTPGLLDFLRPSGGYYGPGGERQQDLGAALASRQNSLIGLGFGLMNQRPGTNSALAGFQTGASTDAEIAARNQALAERKAERLQNQQNWEATFKRTDPEAAPPETREAYDPVTKQNILYQWDRASRSYKRATTGGGTTTAGGTTPGGATAGTGGPQPLLPARKPLTASEEAAVIKADDALLANQQVLGTLQDAKRLSANAFSGLAPLERAQVGAQIPDFLPGMKSNQTAQNTLLLHNKVISQAVDQLKAVFGGNPSEGERKILLDLAGSLNSPDSVRQQIYDDAIDYAKKRIEKNRRQAEGIREGTYYRPGGGDTVPATGGGVRRYNPATGKIE